MFKTRVYILATLFAAAMTMVIGRLAQLQLFRGDYYLGVLEKRQQPRIKLVPAPRGTIMDRYGRVLALDRPSFDLSVRVDQLRLVGLSLKDVKSIRDVYEKACSAQPPLSREALAQARIDLKHAQMALRLRLETQPWVRRLAETIGRERAEIARGLFEALDQVARGWARTFTPVPFLYSIHSETWAQLQAAQEDAFRNPMLLSRTERTYHAWFSNENPDEEPLAGSFPGLVCTYSRKRVYPYGSLLAHVLGTVGNLTPDQKNELREHRSLMTRRKEREKIWQRMRQSMTPDATRKLESILGLPPQNLATLDDLMTHLQRMSLKQRSRAAQWGLHDPVRWAEQPLRYTLTKTEICWLDSTLDLPGRRMGGTRLVDQAIGETGLESLYNSQLRGKPGLQVFDKKASQSEARYLAGAEPKEGCPLSLTIDLYWQMACEEELAASGHPSAMIIMDCQTGAVRAMASYPTFDPNLFVPPRNGDDKAAHLKALFADSSKPLLNRCISDRYPLGSVMKPFIGAVGLELGLIKPSSHIYCNGHIEEGRHLYRCDGSRAHGQVDLKNALRISCNVFFYRLGGRIGVEALSPWARALSLGERTRIDLTGEVPGTFPDRAWRQRVFSRPDQAWDRRWSRGKDYHLAIGQGNLTVTPLQTTCLMAAIANDGFALTPHINAQSDSKHRDRVGFSRRTLSVIRSGMDEVVNVGTPGRKGTAYDAFHKHGDPLSIRVAGKTGTADVGGENTSPHAWFAGYYPSHNPRFAFCVFVQNGGHGGHVAGPIAYRVLKKIYGTRNDPLADANGLSNGVTQHRARQE